jgi:signal peptidase II
VSAKKGEGVEARRSSSVSSFTHSTATKARRSEYPEQAPPQFTAGRVEGFTVLLAVVIIALDQATKALASAFLSDAGSVILIPHVLYLTFVRNTGAAFGLLRGGAWYLLAVGVLCSAAIIASVRRPELVRRHLGVDPSSAWVRIALGFILGGALGNIIDRARWGYVIDFLDFRVWPVFNVADSAITVGGVILGICLWRASSKGSSA